MGKAATEQEKLRQAKARLRRIHHYEQVTHNVSQTCRFFGVSRRQFYTWLHRYHLATPPHIVALILRARAERQYGPIRLCFYLQRFHQVYVSVPTIYKILKRHARFSSYVDVGLRHSGRLSVLPVWKYNRPNEG